MPELKAVVGVVLFYPDGTASQRVYATTPEVAEAVAAELGRPDATSMMSGADMDRVDDAMASVPTIFPEVPDAG
jgi:hypothetical protein